MVVITFNERIEEVFPVENEGKERKERDLEERGIKGALRHFSHEHELILADTSINQISGKHCQACKVAINLTNSPVSAMCYICRLYWHKSCVELPQHITHPFHPHHTLTQSDLSGFRMECDVCGRPYIRRAYKCSHPSCTFCLHLSCAALTPSNASPSISIPADHKIVCPLSSLRNSSHHLILCDVNYTTALQSFCSVCGIEFPKQVQEAALYVCLQCRITVHGSCAHQLLPRQITNHPIHSEHTLKLWHAKFRLKSTTNSIDLGIIYYKCSECFNFNLHPILVTTTTAVVHEHNNNQIIGHIHPVIPLNFQQHKFFRLLCFACQEAIKDDPVICFCRECSVFLHKSCATLPRQIQHPCHLQHPLTVFDSISPQENRRRGSVEYCLACRCVLEGYYYGCDSCHFYLHCKCAMESIFYPPIKSESHPHPLVYFKSGLKCNKKHCQGCQPSDDWGPDSPIFSCRKLTCNFYVHAHCLPKSELPSVVKNIHHLHTLNLTYSQITDSPNDGSDFELYCDSCEERRKPSMPTYYCADCHFVAHVDCNISEVINHFVKNSTVTEEQLVDMESGTSKTDVEVQDLDTEIAVQSTELGQLKTEFGQLKAKLDQLAQEIEIKSEKLHQLEQRRARLLAS